MVNYPVRITKEGKLFAAEFPDASEAVQTAFMAYMADRKDIPPPSRIKRGMDWFTLPALAEAKLALYQAMREAGLRKADVARRLRWHKPQVDRLLDPRHDSRLDQLEQAFAVLGKRISIAIGDAA